MRPMRMGSSDCTEGAVAEGVGVRGGEVVITLLLLFCAAAAAAAAFFDLDFFAGGGAVAVAVGGDGTGAVVGESGRGDRTGERAGESVEVKGKLKLRVTGFSLTTRWRPAGRVAPANSLRLSPTSTTRCCKRQ